MDTSRLKITILKISIFLLIHNKLLNSLFLYRFFFHPHLIRFQSTLYSTLLLLPPLFSSHLLPPSSIQFS